MKEFFRGWRRKIGVVTLATACLLALGWVRSLVIGDQVAVAIDASGHFVTSPLVITTNHFLTSKNGCIRWIRYEIGSNGVNPAYVNPFLIWTKVPLDSPSEPFDEPKIKLVGKSFVVSTSIVILFWFLRCNINKVNALLVKWAVIGISIFPVHAKR